MESEVLRLKGSLQSLDWNGIVEWGERSLLMQFSIKVTPVEVLYVTC